MRGLGAFQIAQMKHRDPRIGDLARHLRAAVDTWEQMMLRPYEPPEPPQPPPSQPEAKAPPPPPPPPHVIPEARLTYTAKQAAAALGIGQTSIWMAIRDGRLDAIKLGSRTLILAESLRAWIANAPPVRRRPQRRGA